MPDAKCFICGGRLDYPPRAICDECDFDFAAWAKKNRGATWNFSTMDMVRWAVARARELDAKRGDTRKRGDECE